MYIHSQTCSSWVKCCCDGVYLYMFGSDSFMRDSFMCVTLYVCCDSFVYVTWIIHNTWRDSFICVTWRMHVCDKTHSQYLTWLIHMCDVTHANMWHASFTILNVTHSYVWRDSFIYVTCLIQMLPRLSIPIRECISTHCNTLQHTATHCNTLQQHSAYTWMHIHR